MMLSASKMQLNTLLTREGNCLGIKEQVRELAAWPGEHVGGSAPPKKALSVLGSWSPAWILVWMEAGRSFSAGDGE